MKTETEVKTALGNLNIEESKLSAELESLPYASHEARDINRRLIEIKAQREAFNWVLS